MPRFTPKKIIHWLHLWLGLASGTIVMVIALTGAIYCFAPEIQDATQPFRFVQPQPQSYLPLSQIKASAQAAMQGRPADKIEWYTSNKAAAITFFAIDTTPRYIVYVNPYTAQINHIHNHDSDFFTSILDGHTRLWLPEDFGTPLVDYASLVFLVLLISGIILWWPNKKGKYKSSFFIRWKVSPKRLNYTLHQVLGFYATPIILCTVLTGLVWGFDSIGNGVYWLSSGGHAKPDTEEPTVQTIDTTANTAHIADSIVAQLLNAQPRPAYVRVDIPEEANAALFIRTNPSPQTLYQASNRFFNPYSGQELSTPFLGKYQDATPAEKLLKMNYDIHTGTIAGLPGRLLLFIAALIVASLPITGFFIWKGRRFKNKKQPPTKELMA